MAKKQNSKKAKKPLNPKIILSLKIAVCVLVVCGIAVAGYFYNESKKEFSSSTKNSIAMGTVVTAKCYGDSAAQTNETILSVVNQLEDVISWRVKGSEVDRVNKGENVKLNELAQIIANCDEVSIDSDGAFDATIGAVSQLWDFGGDNERLPLEKEIEEALKTVDYKKINYTDGNVSVEKGQQLDLGAVGKGYACDMCKTYVSGLKSVKGCVLSVGGSVMTYGKRNSAGDKWRVAIRDPRDENGILGTISMGEGFVSTSGDYEKFFEKDGKRYHHILDARTGYPAESDLISVTIVAKRGVLSDALSTACFILGKEKGKELAEKYGAAGIFVDKDENVICFGDIDFEKA